jgi:hypothetical protein
MTSSITDRAADNGDTATTEHERSRHGLAALRQSESKALISLSTDALSEAFHMGHELHKLLYGKDENPGEQPQELLAETLTCLERAEHYLLMLGSALEERSARNRPPQAVPD